jgi:NAD(P)H-dependent FMN reductase
MAINEAPSFASMPIYNFDDQQATGFPASVNAWCDAIRAADGLLIVTPEYNWSIPGGLKNAIDWASRLEPGDTPLKAFKGKVAGLMAASPGNLGGVRGLAALRLVLGNIGVIVVPTQLAIPRAAEAFEEDGSLKDERQQAAIEAIAAEVVRFAQRLSA